MPVDQASYRGWDGPIRPGRAFAAIASTMIFKQRRSRLVRWIVIGVPLMTCAITMLIFSLTYLLDDSPIRQFMRARGVSLDHVNLLAFVNLQYFHQGPVVFFSILLAALVGGPLIADDRKAKALPLYFSRPVRHLDYVLGKFLTLAFFLGLLLVVPPIAMYLIEISLSPREGVATAQLPTLGYSLIPSLARLTVLSCLALGVSALSERSNHAALLIFGVYLGTDIAGTILALNGDPTWSALSLNAATARLAVAYVPDAGLGNGPGGSGLSVAAAWTSVTVWSAIGLAILWARIRKVEVVT